VAQLHDRYDDDDDDDDGDRAGCQFCDVREVIAQLEECSPFACFLCETTLEMSTEFGMRYVCRLLCGKLITVTRLSSERSGVRIPAWT
jgi:hypothetical protein